jgi:hypothetical protein
LGTLLLTLSVAAAPSSSAPCAVVPTTVRHLAPSEETVVRACARVKWNHTGLAVAPNEAYELTARGSWSDASHTVTAKGYELGRLAAFRPFRRRRDAPWFELIGAVGASERTAFRIGEHAPVTFHASGELVLYANDACFMYWNNTGSIEVIVRRVR